MLTPSRQAGKSKEINVPSPEKYTCSRYTCITSTCKSRIDNTMCCQNDIDPTLLFVASKIHLFILNTCPWYIFKNNGDMIIVLDNFYFDIFCACHGIHSLSGATNTIPNHMIHMYSV